MTEPKFKIGDVFSNGKDRLVIYAVPTKNYSSETLCYSVNYLSNSAINTIQNQEIFEQNQFEILVSSGKLKFELNIFSDIVRIALLMF